MMDYDPCVGCSNVEVLSTFPCFYCGNKTMFCSEKCRFNNIQDHVDDQCSFYTQNPQSLFSPRSVFDTMIQHIESNRELSKMLFLKFRNYELERGQGVMALNVKNATQLCILLSFASNQPKMFYELMDFMTIEHLMKQKLEGFAVMREKMKALCNQYFVCYINENESKIQMIKVTPLYSNKNDSNNN